MIFHAGQKIVCIDARGTNSCGRQELIEQRIYTVVWCGALSPAIFTYMRSRGLLWCAPSYVRLFEFQRPVIVQLGEELPFSAERFRPVVSRRTDISIFTEMLDRTRELVR